jgi:hypothetical protein
MDTRPFDAIRKNSIAIRVSREMALDFGMVKPTPEERAARARQAARFRAWRERHAEQEAAMVAALREQTDPVTAAMMSLHAPNRLDWSGSTVCDGCDYQGYEADPIEWPCRTVYTLATVHGVPHPEAWRP